jgi:hypothetical protein
MGTTRTPIRHTQRWRYPPPPWAREDGRPYSIEIWRKRRDQIMAHEARSGKRPIEWWLYDQGLEPPANETEALREMGALAEDELAELMVGWREGYEKAQEPNFAYCIGHAKSNDAFASWLDGEEARQALYQWVGIPRTIVERWDAIKTIKAASSK